MSGPSGPVSLRCRACGARAIAIMVDRPNPNSALTWRVPVCGTHAAAALRRKYSLRPRFDDLTARDVEREALSFNPNVSLSDDEVAWQQRERQS